MEEQVHRGHTQEARTSEPTLKTQAEDVSRHVEGEVQTVRVSTGRRPSSLLMSHMHISEMSQGVKMQGDPSNPNTDL